MIYLCQKEVINDGNINNEDINILMVEHKYDKIINVRRFTSQKEYDKIINDQILI